MTATIEQRCAFRDFLCENANGTLRKDIILNEEAQIGTTVGVLNKMLDGTLARAKKIDFTDIERSRGDVTNCKFYKNLSESIDILVDIDNTTHKIPGASVVRNTLNTLESSKNEFMKSFRLKNQLGILLYNTMYYSLMEATSYLIAASIDYAVEGKTVTPRVYEVNCRDIVLLDNLTKFNSLAADGSLSKVLKNTDEIPEQENTLNEAVDIGKYWKKFKAAYGAFSQDDTAAKEKTASKTIKDVLGSKAGKAVLITAGVLAGLFLLVKFIPIMRLCIYGIYKIRHKISEAAAMQAKLIELNLQLYKEQGGDDEKVIERQKKAIEFFRKIANIFALEGDKSNRDAKQEDQSDNIDANDIAI